MTASEPRSVVGGRNFRLALRRRQTPFVTQEFFAAQQISRGYDGRQHASAAGMIPWHRMTAIWHKTTLNKC
jgi:hypothetical protein